MNLLIQYLNRLFGKSASVSSYFSENIFPGYLRDRYRFLDLQIHESHFLLLEPFGKKEPLNSMILHLRNAASFASEKTAFLFPSLDEKSRNTLLQMNIPFLVPEKVIFLPSSLVFLEEKKILPIKTTGWFSPSEQLVCLYLFYRRKEWISGPEVAKALSLSPMSVSRALRSLFAMDALDIEGNPPRQKYRRSDRKAYYGIVKSRIGSPVMTWGSNYSGKFDSKEFRLSGMEALAAQTDLAQESFLPSFAFPRGVFTEEEVVEPLKPGEDILMERTGPDMEEWEYDPRLLSKNDYVDPLSLIASLDEMDRKDVRVDAACRKLEEMACEESRNFGIS